MQTNQEVDSPISQGARVSKQVNDALMHGLAFDYRQRTRRVIDFQREMELAIYGPTVGPTPGPSPYPISDDPPGPIFMTVYAGPEPPDPPNPPNPPDLPEPSESGVDFTGKRVAAYLIDLALFGMLGAALQVVLGSAGVISASGMQFALLACLWTFVFMFGFGLALTSLASQATLGMLLGGLRVSSEDGGAASFAGCAVFSLLRAVPALGLVLELIRVGGKKRLIEQLSGLRVTLTDGTRESGATEENSEVISSSVDARYPMGGRAGETRSGTVDDTRNPLHGDSHGKKPPAPEPEAMLRGTEGELKDQTFRIVNGTTAGRAAMPPNVKLPAEDTAASRKQCVFLYDGGSWYLEDDSTSGTMVDRKLVHKARSEALKNGTTIGMGRQYFVFVKR